MPRIMHITQLRFDTTSPRQLVVSTRAPVRREVGIP